VCRIVLVATTRGEPRRLAGQHAEPDRATPVLGHQRHTGQVQAGHQSVHPVHVPGEGVIGGVGGLVGAAEPDVVRRDHPQSRPGQTRDDMPVQKRPGGLAVEQQHHRSVARSGVDIVHPQRRQPGGLDLDIIRLEGITRQVVEPLVGSPQHLHIPQPNEGSGACGDT